MAIPGFAWNLHCRNQKALGTGQATVFARCDRVRASRTS